MTSKLTLAIEQVSVEFPGVLAVEKANIEISAGEVRGIIGENGAGKSTLMKVLSGVYTKEDYTGIVKLEGNEIDFNGVSEAELNGISMIPQDLNLVDELSVAENIFLGLLPGTRGLVDKKSMYQKTVEILKELDLNISPSTKVIELGVAQKQMIVIARALLLDVKVLILDEPTATLSTTESDILFKKIDELKNAGVTCLYVSHRLEEVINICDTVTVMRNGVIVGTEKSDHLTEQKLVSMMIGYDLEHFYPDRHPNIGQVKLSLENFSVYDPKLETKKLVDSVSLEVHEGEILSIFGLVGAGRTEMAKAVIGAWQGNVEGDIFIEGHKQEIKNTFEALSAGIGYLPEDRKGQANIPNRSISDNISVSSISDVCQYTVINRQKELERNSDLFKKFDIRAPDLQTKIKNLSGGNQQKTILSRLLAADSEILILDEPTQGVDVGAKAEIYNLLNELSEQGKAIIFISSDLEEVLGFSDSIQVMREGKLSKKLIPNKNDRYTILEYATLDLEKGA